MGPIILRLQGTIFQLTGRTIFLRWRIIDLIDMSGRYIINEKVTEYLDAFYHAPDPEIGALRAEAEAQGVPVILRDTERFLITLVSMLRPARILEIGTAVGYSAVCFAKAAGVSAEIVTIEKDEQMALQAERNIKRIGYSSRITVVKGDAEERLAELEGVFDLVFIDAAKSHYRRYWDHVIPYCRTGSVIVCDNVLLRGSVTDEGYDSSPRRHHTSIKRMRAFTEMITADPSVETSILTVGDGVSVSIIKELPVSKLDGEKSEMVDGV